MEPKDSRSTKRTRNATDQQKGKRNSQLTQQTRRRTEKPELGMTHIGMFHHFSATALIKLSKPLDGSLDQVETKSFPRLFRGFQISQCVANCQKESPAWPGFPCHGLADQLLLQTVIVFIPASASVRVLNAIGPTWTTVVVVGFLSTMVHFLVALSCTT
jgi:hypothetical protein